MIVSWPIAKASLPGRYSSAGQAILAGIMKASILGASCSSSILEWDG